MTVNEDEASEFTPLLPQNVTDSTLGHLWLESRLGEKSKETVLEDGGHRKAISPNQYRPLSWFHFKKSFQLCIRSYPVYFGLVWQAHKKALVSTVLCSIISGFLPTLSIWTTANLLNEVQSSLTIHHANMGRIKLFAGLKIALALFELIFDYIRKLSQGRLRREMTHIAEAKVLEAKLRLDIAGLLSPFHRDVLEGAGVFCGDKAAINRQGTNSYEADSWGLFYKGSSTITDLTLFVSSLILLASTLFGSARDAHLFRVQACLVLISMTPALIGLLSTLKTYTDRQGWDPYLWRKLRHMASLADFEHRKEIQLHGLADWVLDKWQVAAKGAMEERGLMADWNWLERFAQISGGTLVDTFFKCALAVRMFPESITLGSASLLQSVSTQFIDSLEQLYTSVETMYQINFMLAAFVLATELEPIILPVPMLDEEGKGEPTIYKPMRGSDGSSGMKIQAINLSFKYPGGTKYAVQDLNFTIQPGETVAIVGFNGSGKTTLLQLLARMLDFEGTLLINDLDARCYDIRSLQSSISSCFQDFSKLPLTIRDNIVVGNLPKAGDQALLEKAIDDSGVKTFLGNLPNGLTSNLSRSPEAPRSSAAKTKKEEENPETSISGGEWQKTAVARCFFKVPDSSLVIMDEPSSALDAQAEHDLFEKIEQLSVDDMGTRARTKLYITHRFNTVRRADQILVFETGRIVEAGSHTELMAIEEGTYRKLYNIQAKAFEG